MEDLYSKMGLKLVKRVPVHSNYERLKTKAAAEKKRLEHQIKVLRAKVRTTERVAKEHRERTSARSKRDKVSWQQFFRGAIPNLSPGSRQQGLAPEEKRHSIFEHMARREAG